MASAFPVQVSAVQVGSYFLGQYYPFLQQTPNLVHQFYTDASTMIRYDGENNESASGMAEIHNLIIRLNFTEIEIKTAHSLESWHGGVLVTVTGFVQAKDFICRRKFVETFFLAPQEKGYFVLNDIFLLLEDEQVPQHHVTRLTHNDFDSELNRLDSVQDPVSNYMIGEEIPPRDFISPPIPVEGNNAVDEYNIPAQPSQASAPEERVEETPADLSSVSVSTVIKTVQDQPVPAEECVGEPQKHTYASILRAPKTQTVPHLNYMNQAAMMSSEWQQAPQAAQQQVQLPSSVSERSVSELDEVSAVDDEGESKSVYVGNLPASISTSDLEQEFRNFGRIKADGVTIRSRKEAGVFYAFIEYEDAVGVQNALKASPVQLNGRLIHVEGRRPNSGALRGGRRGRGRGGYNSETPRGRFVGRSFGRGSSLDNDRDYNRPRGNGNLQRPPRQDRTASGNQLSRSSGSQWES